jgi:hypothetical protein
MNPANLHLSQSSHNILVKLTVTQPLFMQPVALVHTVSPTALIQSTLQRSPPENLPTVIFVFHFPNKLLFSICVISGVVCTVLWWGNMKERTTWKTQA